MDRLSGVVDMDEAVDDDEEEVEDEHEESEMVEEEEEEEEQVVVGVIEGVWAWTICSKSPSRAPAAA